MRKTMIRFFTIADWEEEEKWLREQHNKGWRIDKIIAPCFHTFESCEPDDVIYRLDYKNSEETPEYIQMAKDFGWEYIEKAVGWLYFRKPAKASDSDNEGELFSDNESKINMVSRIVHTRLLPLALIFFGCIIPNLMNSVSDRLGIFSGIFAGIFSVLFVIYVFLIIYCGVKLRKIKNKYQN